MPLQLLSALSLAAVAASCLYLFVVDVMLCYVIMAAGLFPPGGFSPPNLELLTYFY